MRRSTSILTAAAVAMSIGGFGASAALALDDDTACSDIAGFTVCALAEHDGNSIIASSASNDHAIEVVLGQYRDEGEDATLAEVNWFGDAQAVAGQAHDDENTLTGAAAQVRTGSGSTWGEALIYNNDDSENDAVYVLVGQSDDYGSTSSGIVWTDDDCDVIVGNQALVDCIVDPTVPRVPALFYVNLP